MNKDTEKQGIESRKRIYNFLIKYIAENGYVPSIREICKAVGLNSTSTVYKHLLVLEDMGKIEMKKKSTRAIKIVGYECMKAR